MRTTAEQGGMTVAAYAGSTGVQLAWDLDPSLRTGLLGFAIRRRAGSARAAVELTGGLAFEGQAHHAGRFLSTFDAPIQAFRWGDYAVYPGITYRY